MKKHVRYLRYLVRHKWFVFLACWRYGIIWQGIIHDWSKFLPSEWLPYAESFYGFKPSDATIRFAKSNGWSVPDPVQIRACFDIAWLKHQHRNPHHWQHWVLREDSGKTKLVAMPHRYVLEMLADWEGAGRAITGKTGGTPAWYAKNRGQILLHPETQAFVDAALGFTAAS